ncbi:hypothetical protein BAE44_0021816, partial [Dichanthelium oligosanthes]
ANPTSQLCRCHQKSHTHLISNCSYARIVWNHVENWSQQQSLTMSGTVTNTKRCFKMLAAPLTRNGYK